MTSGSGSPLHGDTDAVVEQETITVTVERRDALAVAMGGLDYAVAVTEGRAPEGASPMRLRQAIKAALDA